MEKNKKTYISAIPCAHGHIGARFKSNDACVECFKEKKALERNPTNTTKKSFPKRVESPIPNQRVGKPMPDVPPVKKINPPLEKQVNNLGFLLDDPYAVFTYVPQSLDPLLSHHLTSDEKGFIAGCINGVEHPKIELGKKYSSYALLFPARTLLSYWDGEVTDDGLLKLFKRNQTHQTMDFSKIPFKILIDDEDRPAWEWFLIHDSIFKNFLNDISPLEQLDFFNRLFVPAAHIQNAGWGGLFMGTSKVDDVRWIRTTPVETSVKMSDAFKCDVLSIPYQEPHHNLIKTEPLLNGDDWLSLLTNIRYHALYLKMLENSDKILAVDYKKITLGELLTAKKINVDIIPSLLQQKNFRRINAMLFPQFDEKDLKFIELEKKWTLTPFQKNSLLKQANGWVNNIWCYPSKNGNPFFDHIKQLTPEVAAQTKRTHKYQTPQEKVLRGKIIDAKIVRSVEHGTVRAQAKQATPKWANVQKMEQIYSRRAKEEQVDHIVPLNHPFVCGLHWEGNLEAIPKKENQEKGNKIWPDMPEYTKRDYAQLMTIKKALHIIDYDISAVFRRWKDGKLRHTEWDFILDNVKAFDSYLSTRTAFDNEDTHRKMWDGLNKLKPTLQNQSTDKILELCALLHVNGKHMTWQDANTFLLMITAHPEAWKLLEIIPLDEKYKQPYKDAKEYAHFLGIQFRDVFFIKNAHYLKERNKPSGDGLSNR